MFRVLSDAGRLRCWSPKPSKKGAGFEQPLEPHEHWHIDIAHINIHGTFYYLCAVLDGASRYLVAWGIRESMTEADVEVILQRAKEKFPEARPRIISDNGPQFIAKDFKEEGSLATMLPGKGPDVYDVFGDGSTAKYVPAGARLRFQIHYAKVDRADTDRTSIGLYRAAKPPANPLKRVDVRNRFFLISAGAAQHEVKRCYDAEQDRWLVAITPHMHYRGKDATYELVDPDGRREILLRVPAYDFNWQLQYRFKDLFKCEDPAPIS